MRVRMRVSTIHPVQVTAPKDGTEEHERVNASKITLQPVAESEENAAIFAGAPTGYLILGSLNEAAAAELPSGAEFFLDFSPADQEPEGEGHPTSRRHRNTAE